MVTRGESVSRISRTPIALPSGVAFALDGASVTVKGKRGQLSVVVPSSLVVEKEGEGDKLRVRTRAPIKVSDLPKELSMLCGTFKRLIQNMVIGVSDGFSRTLELNGVGYRAEVQGKILKLKLGYSHESLFDIPSDIDIKAEKPTILTILGSDKQRVGQVVSEIRKLRPPEPYKGKGIRRSDEFVRRKEGKRK